MAKPKKPTGTVLVVAADPKVREVTSRTVVRDGHQVLEAIDGQAALTLARNQRPGVIIIDTAMSELNGFDLCARLRKMPFIEHTPILFLSDCNDAQYVARALDCGGDDYLRRPFSSRELNARVRALLRRSRRRPINDMTTLRIDTERQQVTVNGRTIILTPTEFQLLSHLCHHPHEHHTAPRLLQVLWQYPPGLGDTALVRNHIRNLRRKIEIDPDHPAIIVSMHGRGYMVNAQILN